MKENGCLPGSLDFSTITLTYDFCMKQTYISDQKQQAFFKLRPMVYSKGSWCISEGFMCFQSRRKALFHDMKRNSIEHINSFLSI